MFTRLPSQFTRWMIMFRLLICAQLWRQSNIVIQMVQSVRALMKVPRDGIFLGLYPEKTVGIHRRGSRAGELSRWPRTMYGKEAICP